MIPQKLSDIYDSIISSIEVNIGQTVNVLPVAFIRVFSKSFAGVLALLYKYAGFIWTQTYPSTASIRKTTIGGVSLTPLIEWGTLTGVGDPTAASAAELTIEIVVTNQTGDPIASGTLVTYEPTGVLYATKTTVLRNAATITVDVVAVGDQTDGGGLGVIGNIPVGALVSFTQPLADINRGATVTVVVVTGADGEDLDTAYRARVVNRFQKRPQGGAMADYEEWALQAPGIIGAFPYSDDLPGCVAVYVEATVASSGSEFGFPTQSQLDATLASIEANANGRAENRPANAFVFVHSITRRAFNVQVSALAAADLPATKLAIEAGLQTLFKSYAPYIGGLTVVPKDRITRDEVAGVVFDIARANNATFSSIILNSANTATVAVNHLVTASGDDATQAGVGAAAVINGTTLAMTGTSVVGLRWLGLNIPAGSTISSATLTMTSKSVKSAYSVVTVQGQADVAPLTFTATTNNITSRTKTINATTWVPDAWAVDDEKIIDVTAIVAEVIAISGWASGNNLAIILTSASGSDREAYSYDDTPAKAPKLTVEFSDPNGLLISQSVVTLAKGERASLAGVTF